MSFFKNFFGGSSIEDEKYLTVEIMNNMANESERAHRAMIDLYNKEIDMRMLKGDKSEVSWRGIYKARLLVTMFPFFMFNAKWRKKDEKIVMELMNIASGVAVTSLHDADIEYDRVEAEKILYPFIKKCLKAIKNEFDTGPSNPMNDFYTEGFKTLEKISHDSLSESIGRENYTEEVKSRFELPLKSGITSALRATVEEFGTPI